MGRSAERGGTVVVLAPPWPKVTRKGHVQSQWEAAGRRLLESGCFERGAFERAAGRRLLGLNGCGRRVRMLDDSDDGIAGRNTVAGDSRCITCPDC